MKRLLVFIMICLLVTFVYAQENGSIIELGPGDSKKILLPETYEYESVKWESSDRLVAEVNDDGYIYTTKPGEAIVTATLNTGEVIKYNIVVKTDFSNIFNKVKTFVIDNLIVFEVLIVLCIIFIFIKYT